MRILKVEITGFGHYRQKTLTFDAHNQLFYGENEAGKSTLYQFIYAMLFGFTKKSAKKRDYTPQDGSAYGGRLWFENTRKQCIKIERFRQVDRGKAKVFIDDQEVAIALEKLLEPLTPQTFQEIYTFQQEQLSQIDHLQEQEFHEALLSLGISGSQQLIEVVKQEERNSQQLFRPRGRNLPLNQKIVALEGLQEKITEKEQQESTVQQLYHQLSEMKQTMHTLEQEAVTLRQTQQILEQQRLNWPLYEEWQQLLQQNKTLLTAKEQAQIEQIYQQYQVLRQAIQFKTDQIAKIEQDQTSERYFFYLDHEAVIKQLKSQYLEIMKALEQEASSLSQQQEIKTQLSRYAKQWNFTPKTPPQAIDPRVYEDLSELEQLQEQQIRLEEKLNWYHEKQKLVETEVAQLEEQLVLLEPETAKLSMKHIGLVLLGIILGFAFLFVNSWVALMIWALTGILFIATLRKRPNTQALELLKAQWQAKLTESNKSQAEVAALVAEHHTQEQNISVLFNRLNPFFNQAPQTQWEEILQHYQEAVTDYQQLVEQDAQITEQLAQIEPLLTQTLSALKPFYAWFSIATLSLDQQIKCLFDFDEEMQQVKLERSQNPSMQLAREIKELREQETTLLQEATVHFSQQGITQVDEIPVLLKQWTIQRENKKRQEELATMLSPLFPKTITKTQWEMKVAQNKQQLLEITQKQQEQTTKIQRLTLELEQLQEDGTLDEWYQKRTQLEDQVRQMSVQWAAQKVHAALLTQLATTRSDEQFPHLMQKVSEYFTLLTDGRYQQVLFHEGSVLVRDHVEQYDIYQLSTGTKDQLIMAFRFAYLAMQTASHSPVIIDDGWLHYDHKRKYHLAKLLAYFGRENQVICLSSDREMVSYYQEEQQAVFMLTEGM